ncbi:MAG: VCBS repeat-containing protein [Deltaproteobacteria bacterium]|nr:VCBS repeat-containing protein [Deltaproteobacteria bacterium]
MDKRRGRYALALITSLSAVGIILVVYYRGESTDGDFLGPPSGRIAFSSPLILSVQENPEQLVVDDFNRDGRLDFAVANTGSHSISVFQNLGERDFLPKVYANIVRSLALWWRPTWMSMAMPTSSRQAPWSITFPF